MSFDLLAPCYRWMERVLAGRKLQRCRLAFLDELPNPRRILIVGEGHGRSLVACRRQFPLAQILCVEQSAAMIEQARRNLSQQGLGEQNVEFVQVDVFDWKPAEAEHDVIVTHFFLDCFPRESMSALIHKLAQAGTANAHWLVADFQIADAGWRRMRCQIILWLLYRFFRFATHLPAHELVAPDPFLQEQGFRLHRRVETEWGLLKSEWWQRDGEVVSVPGLARLSQDV